MLRALAAWVREQDPSVSPEEPVEELPIREVPEEDWNDQVERAKQVCRLIDRHLEYEGRGRLLCDLGDFRPQNLCPEQRVAFASDLYAVSR